MSPTAIAIARDIKNTFAIWRLNPGSTLAAFFALTVGLGATTAIFSVVSSLLLQPLPVPNAERVVHLAALDRSNQPILLSMPDALDLQQRIHTDGVLAVYRSTISNLAGNDHNPVVAHVLDADAALFQVMEIRMAQGRAFRPSANQPGRSCEVVIAWPFWKVQFGGRQIAGETVRLNEQPCVIDGVLPQNLDLPTDADVWRALTFDLHDVANGRAIQSLEGLARLRPGVSVVSFNAELATSCGHLSREHPPEDTGLRVIATPLRDWLTRDAKSSVFILFAAVAGVLLMACANVANLLLARSSARLREMAVRIAIGATRLQLIQQLLTESLMLGLASSLAGLILAMIAVKLVRNVPATRIPRPESIVIDWRVLVFAIGTAMLTALLFGAMPALRVSFTSLKGVLSQAGGRISDTRRQQAIRKLLVAVETALATVLLIASLLMLQSFIKVSRIDPGFATDHLLTAYLSLPATRYGKDTNDVARFARNLLERLKANPDVVDAAVSTNVPLQSTAGSGPVQIEGQPLPEHESEEEFVLNTGISPGFRKTLKIPLLAGRDLEAADDRDSGKAVLVNATFARLFFPHQNAVGKRLRYSPNVNKNAAWMEVVGVIGDTRQNGLEGEVEPELYQPLAISASLFPAVIVRTSGNSALYLRKLEASIHAVDSEVPVFLPRTMEQVEIRRMGSRLFNTALLTGFACVAVLLACGGIFAVIAYSVSQRTSEIGVRMACGADAGDIVRLITRQGMTPALAGIGVGIVAALFVNRFLAALLYGVQDTDLAAYAGAVLLLAFCSALACWLPARRAARVEPWRALRYE